MFTSTFFTHNKTVYCFIPSSGDEPFFIKHLFIRHQLCAMFASKLNLRSLFYEGNQLPACKIICWARLPYNRLSNRLSGPELTRKRWQMRDKITKWWKGTITYREEDAWKIELPHWRCLKAEKLRRFMSSAQKCLFLLVKWDS